MRKNYAKSFRPSNMDLSEDPKSAENLVRGFHGREVQSSKTFSSPHTIDYSTAQLLGRSDVIFYQSDKRDPKDPDGEGAQGYMKRFYHDQNPPSYLYIINVSGDRLDSFLTRLINEAKDSGLAKKVKKKGLFPKGPTPDTIIELGILEKVELSNGKDKSELHFTHYKLYCWDNMKTLMAIGYVDGKFLDDQIYIWASKHTKVNWRGIID